MFNCDNVRVTKTEMKWFSIFRTPPIIFQEKNNFWSNFKTETDNVPE